MRLTTKGVFQVKLVFDIFQDVCPSECEIKEEVLIRFLTAVASHYRDNPYHTFLHACYVLHAVWMVCQRCSTKAISYLV